MRTGGLNGVRAPLDALLALRLAARQLHTGPRHRDGALAGPWPAQRKGHGIEFADVRAWQPGDDLRHIDWRVSARTGRPHTREYREERESPLIIVSDVGATTALGTQRRLKSVAIAELSALLLWRALDSGQQVGAVINGAGPLMVQRPQRSRAALSHILAALEHACERRAEQLSAPANVDEPGVSLVQLTTAARRASAPGSTLVLLSDFEALRGDDAEVAATQKAVTAALGTLARNRALTLIRVSDPIEREPPPAGNYAVSDGHYQQQLDVASRVNRNHWRLRYQAQTARLQALAQRCSARFLDAGTEEDLLNCLADWR